MAGLGRRLGTRSATALNLAAGPRPSSKLIRSRSITSG